MRSAADQSRVARGYICVLCDDQLRRNPYPVADWRSHTNQLWTRNHPDRWGGPPPTVGTMHRRGRAPQDHTPTSPVRPTTASLLIAVDLSFPGTGGGFEMD